MGLLRIDRFRPAGSLRTATGRVLGGTAFIAGSPATRAVGMLGTPDPRAGELLILVPCRAVHGIGLRAAIGAAFVDARGIVLEVVDPLPARGARRSDAAAVVEARAGSLSVAPGDRLVVTDACGFPLRGVFPFAGGGRTWLARALSDHRGHSAPAHDRSSP